MTRVVALICNALVTIVLMVGTGIAVFGLGHSGWWFVAAVAIDLAVTQTVKTAAPGAKA